jgi:hypothetical protein
MRINKNIAISDSGLVFNPVNGESFSINPIGVEIISQLKEGKSLLDINKVILDRYAIDKDTFEKDFQDFIGILGHHNIIEGHDEKKT